MMSILRSKTIDVINNALENGIDDAGALDDACRVVCDVMDLVCRYVEKHGNIALSIGSEWLYDSDKAQVDALDLVARILDSLCEYAEGDDGV